LKDYYSILGVDRNATKKEIRDAYLKLARDCHPDHMPRESKWVLVNERFAEITEAYEVLTTDSRKIPYDRQLKAGVKTVEERDHEAASRVQAERAYANGFQALKKKDYNSAHAFFKAASGLDPSVAKYKSYQGLAQAYTGFRLKESIELCSEAIQKEMYNSDLYVNLAIVYKLAGRTEDCKKRLMEALKWNSRDRRAAELLTEMRKEGGFFRKLFGKGGASGRA
jgi:curved DNA-binding protein CbpA